MLLVATLHKCIT